jgi:prepilin-type N-terminal cleavage/methylation domain-containing protein
VRPGDRIAAQPRRGLTLVEVIVAMAILTAVILVLGAFTAKFAQANSQAHLVIAANELAARRLDEVRQQASYPAVDNLKDSSTITYDVRTFTRTTKVTRIGGAPADSVDYKLITVTVTHPSMTKTVAKTTAIAAF